ncbi:lipid A export permease/ATP-binding protein MsbA [Caldimonas sp. KR1-144]|uniref:lipid A export permease/ATP-binding protein MsbA n=1 Tax=Caldimonas sp. KR1-144 TaxID=3400911 RepID=UPI003C05E632
MLNPSPSIPERLRELLPYFGDSRWPFAVAALGAAIGGACEAAFARMMKPLLDQGFLAQGFPLWAVPLAIIGLFLVRGLAGFVVDYSLAWVANRGTLRMRGAMFSRLLGSNPALMSQQTSSSLINTVVYELQSGANQLVNAAQILMKDSLTVAALLGYLVWVNWQLTLMIALLFPSVAWVMRVFGKRMHRLTREGQKATDQLAYVVEENVLAWRLVRLHDAAPLQRERFARASDAVRRLVMKSTVASSVLTPTTQLLTACALSAVIVLALWQGREQGSTVGTFVSYIVAMATLINPLRRLSDVTAPVTRGLAAVQRGLALAHHAPQETGGTHAPATVHGHLLLRDVSLRYKDDQRPALDAVTLDIPAGKTIALVGPSGAGKSTLVNMLPRFLEPSAGEIRLDGVPLPQWDLRALRSQFALVSQEVVLFNDTIAANVSFGDTLDRDRVIQALRGANLLEYVEALPQGLDTVIGHNGRELSGGQRQRLAIARAIYKNAPILLLDEATSALDTESERMVQSALEKLMAGRTSIVIAHRLSTIEAADRVVVLDEGRVIEEGTHAELIARGGLFSRLHALQFNT